MEGSEKSAFLRARREWAESVHVHNIVNTALFTLDIDLLGVLCYALTIKTGKNRSDRGDIIWQLP